MVTRKGVGYIMKPIASYFCLSQFDFALHVMHALQDVPTLFANTVSLLTDFIRFPQFVFVILIKQILIFLIGLQIQTLVNYCCLVLQYSLV